MKKILVILSMFLIFPTVLAINLTIEQQSTNEVMIIDANQPAEIFLQVTNNGETDNFRFYTFFGLGLDPIEKIQIKKGETKDIKLVVYPRQDYEPRGFSSFNYFIKASDGEELTQRLTINVIDLKDAFEIGTEQFDPDSTTIELYVYNKVNFNFEDLQASFSSPFFNLDKTFNIFANDKKTFKIDLNKEDFEELMAGYYTLKTNINFKETLTNLETNMKFSEKDILETNQDSYGFIINTKIIEKANKGNVIVETTTTIKKNILSRIFTTLIPTPDIVDRRGFNVYYTWNSEINPGETLEIKVKTNWILPFILILLIVAILLLTNFYLKRDVVLRKKVHFVKAKGGEFALKVSILVQAKKYVEKVNIVDRLPPLVRIYERFVGEEPTNVDKAKKRLHWNFEKLEEGERRVLSYIIYSKVGIVGKFALPKTNATYQREGKIKESNSNQTYFVAEQVAKRE